MRRILTRSEAEQRSGLLRVHTYHVYLDLVTLGSEERFRSRVKIRFECSHPGESSWIEVLGRIRSAVLNDKGLKVQNNLLHDRLALPHLDFENVLEMDCEFEYSNSGHGLHRFTDPADGQIYVYSHLQVAHAARVFPCFDQPDLKATLELNVRTPQSWTVIANGPIAEVSAVEDGTLVHEFEPTPPISTYVMAVAAGPFRHWSILHNPPNGSRTIPLSVYARESLASFIDASTLLSQVARGITFYSAEFDTEYPFPKLDLCFVPEFNFGAMENAACITIAEMFVFDRVVTRHAHQRRSEMLLHELAHQWFGNLVTLRWWDDLWLNEAFATWASLHAQTQVTDYSSAWADFSAGKKATAYALDQLPTAHPVIADVPDAESASSHFDALTYHKGASALRQLVAKLGRGVFLDVIHQYFSENAFGNSNYSALITALSEVGRCDLSSWTESWLQLKGLTCVEAEFEVNEEGQYTRFALSQKSATADKAAPLPHRIAVGVYDHDARGVLVRVHRHEIDLIDRPVEIPQLVGKNAGKLVLPNDDDLSYCVVQLDPASAEMMVERIGDIVDPLPRMLCWTAGWEMLRRGDLASDRFLSMVLTGLGSESQIGMVQILVRRAATVLSRYCDQRWAREHGWPTFVDRLLQIADKPKTADHRLTFVRAVADAALTPQQVTVVSDWLGDNTDLGMIDRDLRWRLMRAAIAHGQADESAIVELGRADPSASGRRWEARLRASVPTSEAKERAWQEATSAGGSNAHAQAVTAGFVHPAHYELLRPFAERYARDIPALWRNRPADHACSIASALFPLWAASEHTRTVIDGMLELDQPVTLRRMIDEHRYELVLAIRLAATHRARAALRADTNPVFSPD